MRYDDRKSSASRGYGHKWRKARESFLATNSLCSDHKARGYVVMAVVVDHIIPHRLSESIDGGDQAKIDESRRLFWDRNNWQPLCKLCHDSHKQKLEKSGIDVGCDRKGMPTDINHHWNNSGGR